MSGGVRVLVEDCRSLGSGYVAASSLACGQMWLRHFEGRHTREYCSWSTPAILQTKLHHSICMVRLRRHGSRSLVNLFNCHIMAILSLRLGPLCSRTRPGYVIRVLAMANREFSLALWLLSTCSSHTSKFLCIPDFGTCRSLTGL